jgi:hypothetical protein
MIDESSGILILCHAYDDGWVYAKTLSDNKIWVIKPPYNAESYEEINESTIEVAVSKHGFSCADLPENAFPNLEKLVEFLITKYIELHEEPIDTDGIKQLIHYASPKTIGSMIDSFETKFSPEKDDEGALGFLKDLLTTEVVKGDIQLRERINTLLESIQSIA